MLEKLIEYEAVHPMRSWADLRDRLDRDRRCYALFHPGIPDEPLAFVELALLDRLHSSIQTILDEGAPRVDSKGARVAMFYSISNTQPGLRGIGLGALLIERALELLREELPQLRTFVTLSPVPLLAQWLRDNAESMVGLIRAEEASDLCALA